MKELVAYNEYAKLKYNTIVTMKIFPSKRIGVLLKINLAELHLWLLLF